MVKRKARAGRLCRKEEVDIMLTLYHGTTSVCSAKVRLALAEKGLAWDGHVLDLQRGDQHRSEYLALNPNAVVPTLVHDGTIIIESTIILEYLEETFPETPLMPASPAARARVREWMKLVDEKLHAATGTVTFATANRKVLLRKTPEELEAHFAKIPDPAYRARQREAVELGLAAPTVQGAATIFRKAFARMEESLRNGTFLVGDAYSLADISLIPYLNRAELLGMDVLWNDHLPALKAWWARMRAWPTFEPTMEAVLQPKDRERFTVDRDAVRAALNGPAGA